MINLTSFQDKTLLVFGLGQSGLSVIKSLQNSNIKLTAWDDNFESRENAKKIGVKLVDYSIKKMDFIDYLILSPGVPLTHPTPHWIVKKAYQNNIPIIGDVELFFKELSSREHNETPIVAVTGTNGKSTTTALIGHILKSAGIGDVQIGGNLGSRDILEFDEPNENTVYVIELSSYQLDLTPSIKPDIGVMINISPDHLDRHGSMDNYANVKAKIFSNMQKGQAAIIGVDDAWSKDIYKSLKGDFLKIALSNDGLPYNGVGVDSLHLFDDIESPYKQVMDVSELEKLPGKHNWQNICAAFATCRLLGLPSDDIVKGIESFNGLAHRLEKVGMLGDTTYINDSKATNVEAAAKSLSLYENIIWILGGQAKEGGVSGLEKYFSKVKKAFIIGESSDQLASQMEGKVEYQKCDNLKIAVDKATKFALRAAFIDPVILLSPACASFDQFRNFEQRGSIFRELVAETKGVLLTTTKEFKYD